MILIEELLEETDNILNKESLTPVQMRSWKGIPRWISSWTLKHVMGREVFGEELLAALHAYGIDTNYNAVLEQKLWHRPEFFPTNAPWLGTRYIGLERSDRGWLSTGWASDDMRIMRSNFSDLGVTIAEMSRRANPTAEIIDHIRGKQNAPRKQEGEIGGL